MDQQPKEDIAQTVERKRQEFNQAQEKQGVGTLAGFLGMLRKRREQTEQLGSKDLEASTGGQDAK